MNNTLNIGAYIYSTLTAGIEDIKTYPLVADNDAKFPFIVYKRTGLNKSDTKDGWFQDIATIEITVVSDKYADGIETAILIRNLLEKDNVEFGDYLVDGNLVSATEDYVNNAFIQKMQFQLTINK